MNFKQSILTAEKCNNLSGNQICEDEANNAECQFDNGDCCKAIIDDMQCKICICHIDGKRHPNESITTTTQFLEGEEQNIDWKFKKY